ncbi:MAG: hypothetical protein L0027_12935, partial [Candidatus Rokubacteria bacterium]|nr:hypothetical protein [Candidatus Rokubacteria bacterium]
MISTTQALQAILDAVTWESLAGLVLRATLVAGLGHLALLLLRRSAAATRHLVALAALAAVVALPLTAAVAPRLAPWTLTTTLLPPAPAPPPALAADG